MPNALGKPLDRDAGRPLATRPANNGARKCKHGCWLESERSPGDWVSTAPGGRVEVRRPPGALVALDSVRVDGAAGLAGKPIGGHFLSEPQTQDVARAGLPVIGGGCIDTDLHLIVVRVGPAGRCAQYPRLVDCGASLTPRVWMRLSTRRVGAHRKHARGPVEWRSPSLSALTSPPRSQSRTSRGLSRAAGGPNRAAARNRYRTR
jgi:hypothetical protein